VRAEGRGEISCFGVGTLALTIRPEHPAITPPTGRPAQPYAMSSEYLPAPAINAGDAETRDIAIIS
jgi:hypothetical protein